MKTSTSLLSITVWFATAWAAFPYTVTLVPGLTMVANHFNHTPNNRLGNFFQPPPPDGSMVFVWNKNTQSYNEPYLYIDGFGWFSSSDPDPLGPVINPGEGFFFQNPTSASFTRTITGAAVTPVPVTLPLNTFCIVANQQAAPGGFQDIIGSPPAPGFCTRLYRWNTGTQRYDLYSSPGTLTAIFPTIPTGESVFVIRGSPDTTPPKLVTGSMNVGAGTILLEFSEAMHPGLATQLSAYVLSGGPGTLVSANMYPVTTPPPSESKFVQLNATGLSGSSVYKLNIVGPLADLCGNALDTCTQIGLNCGPPTNDFCIGALFAVIGPNPGTTICSSTDGSSACDNICPGGDVWYQYTPPCNGTVTFDTCGSPLDTILSVWNGCPGSITASELACDDDSCPPLQSTVTLTVTSCGTYYIRVSGSQGAFGNFTLNVSFSPSAPPNNACANAIILGTGGLSANGVYPFNTCNATTDGPGAQPIINDIWYRYTPTCSGPVHVSTCGSAIDTALAVYAGSCAGTLMGFNNDAASGVCVGSLQSFVTFAATAGTQYFIRVGSNPSTATGCGQLVVVGPNPLVGTCPPGVPPLGTGVNTVFTRFFEVTGNSSGTPWAWSISAPCCYWVQNLSVPGVTAGSPPSALAAAFVASINTPCPPFPPSPPFVPDRLTATQVGGQFILLAAYGCNNDIVFSVGPAGTLAQNQCVIPNPADFLPTSGPCSFNPPIVEIPLSKRDCNRNDVDDLVDIVAGTSLDLNGNRIPDECETCARPGFVVKPAAQEAKPGQSATFSAQAQGAEPLAYQWLFNGAPLPNATRPTLLIDPVRSTDAGRYQVVISNPCGQIRSAPVPLTLVGEKLQISFRNGRVEVSWNAPNMLLQSAPTADGTWATVDNAVSPFIIWPPEKQEFFRLIDK